MSVNMNKTKVMVFRKSGRLTSLTQFYYNNEELEIVEKFSYLGIVFSTGGSFSNLFDKLISPVLNYASQVWGFIQGSSIERVHLQYFRLDSPKQRCASPTDG